MHSILALLGDIKKELMSIKKELTSIREINEKESTLNNTELLIDGKPLRNH